MGTKVIIIFNLHGFFGFFPKNIREIESKKTTSASEWLPMLFFCCVALRQIMLYAQLRLVSAGCSGTMGCP